MARFYYYTNDQVTGPVSARQIMEARNTFLITGDSLICRHGSDQWMPLKQALPALKRAYRAEMLPKQNRKADGLLTACVVAFSIMASLQIAIGLILCCNRQQEMGIALLLSAPAFLFPIAVAYAMRQMFRSRLHHMGISL